MLTLKAEKRNPDEKAKKLRRDGFITGVLYGKEMKENVSLKFTEKDASAFIKNAKEGTQAYLELDGKNVDVLVKNIDFDPLTKKYMALDFQALVAGEIVSATVPIVYVNEDKVQGIFEAELSEVHYKADPAHLLDPIEIDLAALPQTTKTMYVKDLKLEEKVCMSLPPENSSCSISESMDRKRRTRPRRQKKPNKTPCFIHTCAA